MSRLYSRTLFLNNVIFLFRETTHFLAFYFVINVNCFNCFSSKMSSHSKNLLPAPSDKDSISVMSNHNQTPHYIIYNIYLLNTTLTRLSVRVSASGCLNLGRFLAVMYQVNSISLLICNNSIDCLFVWFG